MTGINRRRVLKAGGAAVAGVSISGCLGGDGDGDGDGSGDGSGNGDGGTTTPQDLEPLKIGYVTGLSGPFGVIGERGTQGNEIAIDEINENDGINGRQVEVLTRDTELDPSTAIQHARDLINSENVDVLFGPVSSGVAAALLPVAERNEIALLTSVSAARNLTGADCNRYFFRLKSNTELQAIGFCPWLYDNIGQSMSVAYSDYNWGQTGRDDMRTYFEEAGGEFVNSVGIPLGESDLGPYISEIDTSADILVCVTGGSDTINLMNALDNFGVKEEMTIAGPPSFMGNILTELGGDLRDGAYFISEYPDRPVGPWDNELNNQFQQKHIDRFGTPGTYHPGTAYNRTKTWAEAARAAEFSGRSDTDALISTLEGIEVDRTQSIVAPATLSADDHNLIPTMAICQAVAGDDVIEFEESVSHTDLAAEYPDRCEAF